MTGTVITRRVSADGLPCSWSSRGFAVVSGYRGAIEGYIAGECHALFCIFFKSACFYGAWTIEGKE